MTQKDNKAKEIQISIDRQKIKLPAQSLSAETLRSLAEPDIGPDRDLYVEGRGKDPDTLVEAGQMVKLRDGMHFFTAPATIQPGHAA